jgi:hypothetical protein
MYKILILIVALALSGCVGHNRQSIHQGYDKFSDEHTVFIDLGEADFNPEKFRGAERYIIFGIKEIKKSEKEEFLLNVHVECGIGHRVDQEELTIKKESPLILLIDGHRYQLVFKENSRHNAYGVGFFLGRRTSAVDFYLPVGIFSQLKKSKKVEYKIHYHPADIEGSFSEENFKNLEKIK